MVPWSLQLNVYHQLPLAMDILSMSHLLEPGFIISVVARICFLIPRRPFINAPGFNML